MISGLLNVFLPEGCTPADAKHLRRANHAFADELFDAQNRIEILEDLLKKAATIIEHDNETLRQTHTITGDDWGDDADIQKMYDASRRFIDTLRGA